MQPLPPCSRHRPAHGEILFTENFEAANAADNWDVFSTDASFPGKVTDQATTYGANFAFNYGAFDYKLETPAGDDFTLQKIPAAPGGAGNLGLKIAVNKPDATINAVSAYPKLRNFSGDYKLKFDMWMNYNGLGNGTPGGAGGGNGSTHQMLAGLNMGAAGNRVAGPVIVDGPPPVGGENTGYVYALSNEGGSGTDYRAYEDQLNLGATGWSATGTAVQNNSNAFYQGLFNDLSNLGGEYETGGVPGKHWVQVEISSIGGVVAWRLNGTLVHERADTTYNSGNITVGMADFVGVLTGPNPPVPSDTPTDSFTVFDNIVVESLSQTLYWDIDGTTPGGGGATPGGNWDGAGINFNSDPAGGNAGITTAVTTASDTVVFAAGADGTGDYAVNVTGTARPPRCRSPAATSASPAAPSPPARSTSPPAPAARSRPSCPATPPAPSPRTAPARSR